jgi:hypothetical protein
MVVNAVIEKKFQVDFPPAPAPSRLRGETTLTAAPAQG